MLISCGGGGTTTAASSLKKRVFVTNSYAGVIQIVDASKDLGTGFTVPQSGAGSTLGPDPTFMTLSADNHWTLVFSAGDNSIEQVDNVQETNVGRMALPSWTESIVISPDTKTAWVAVRNAAVTGQPTGAIGILDLINQSVSGNIPVPLVRRIALNHAGTKLLAFSDLSDSVALVNVASNTVIATVPGFDRPVWGVFSSDDSKAYILSCGPECGGSATPGPNVRVLDMTTNTPGAAVNVPAGTVGFLNGATLYVAGSTPAGGAFSVVNTTTMALTTPPAGVPIGDGHHSLMSITDNGKLYIGAQTCTNNSNVANSGCLSIVDTASLTATVPPPNCDTGSLQLLTCGDVTGVQPITGRTVVYVIQGGELIIYDGTTSTPLPLAKQLDFVGKIVGVELVD